MSVPRFVAHFVTCGQGYRVWETGALDCRKDFLKLWGLLILAVYIECQYFVHLTQQTVEICMWTVWYLHVCLYKLSYLSVFTKYGVGGGF